MNKFYTVIQTQTDKPRLVRFAIDCARRVVFPSDQKGQAALNAAEQWLKEPSDENAEAVSGPAIASSINKQRATTACSFAALTAYYFDVGESASYAAYTAYTASRMTDDKKMETMWQIARFKELFPTVEW